MFLVFVFPRKWNLLSYSLILLFFLNIILTQKLFFIKFIIFYDYHRLNWKAKGYPKLMLITNEKLKSESYCLINSLFIVNISFHSKHWFQSWSVKKIRIFSHWKSDKVLELQNKNWRNYQTLNENIDSDLWRLWPQSDLRARIK